MDIQIGQIVKCRNSWGRWEETSVVKIDELDSVPYKWYCANGISTFRPDQDFTWKNKPKIKPPPPYRATPWNQGQKVKFMPYTTLSFKPMVGIIREDYGDGFVLIEVKSGEKMKIPELNILRT